MRRGRLRVIERLPAFLFVSTVLTSEASGFDVSRYHPTTIQAIIRDLPVQSETVVIQELPIRSRVTYTGEFRDLPEDSRHHIQTWADLMTVPDAPRVFRQELKVYEGGTAYWLPVQDVLVPAMRSELRPGQGIEVFMIFIVQVRGRSMFLVNAFDADS